MREAPSRDLTWYTSCQHLGTDLHQFTVQAFIGNDFHRTLPNQPSLTEERHHPKIAHEPESHCTIITTSKLEVHKTGSKSLRPHTTASRPTPSLQRTLSLPQLHLIPINSSAKRREWAGQWSIGLEPHSQPSTPHSADRKNGQWAPGTMEVGLFPWLSTRMVCSLFTGQSVIHPSQDSKGMSSPTGVE